MTLITFDERNQVFHLSNKTISYIIGLERAAYLSHLYFGKAIKRYHNSRKYPLIDRSFSPNPAGLPLKTRDFSLDVLPQEMPSHGHGDFRNPAVQIKQVNGSSITDFVYDSYEIIAGKPALKRLPATYVESDSEAETLVITLVDRLLDLTLKLSYTIFADRQVIARNSFLENKGQESVIIKKIASASLDLVSQDLELISLAGRHNKEREIERQTVQRGTRIIDSKRGSSSHQANPFIALVSSKTDEFTGTAIGLALVYSGNHEMLVERDQFEQTRVMAGINPFGFEWELAPSQSFQSPEALLVFSDQGLNGMSQAFHDVLQNRLARGKFRHADRPILINNWEATYFDFNTDKIKAIVDGAADLGIELFVLDDGWFGKREDDTSGLGDWFENTDKLSGGLAGISDYVHGKNMSFGLWFEPEMVNADSDLYRAHPDYALQIPNRSISTSRDQYVLDFSRKDVRETIIARMRHILDTVNIDYIKWDMNRSLTDVYSSTLDSANQGEVFHRYVLGLYEMLETLTTEYDHILWEGCSGGGGRFDPGFLYYMPQSWTSDNTDAVERLDIQYGTSLLYPISSMGSHVSVVPNHQTHRVTGLDIRGDVAMSGVFGYELNVQDMTIAEKVTVSEQVAFYKQHRQLLQYGKFHRLVSPFETSHAAWLFVNPDKSQAIAFYFRKFAESAGPLHTIKFAGLDPEKVYQVNGEASYGGDELMHVGIYLDPFMVGDYQSRKFVIDEVI
ncbi:MAG: alpha-galactosidase [Lactococcus sp.]|uniref:alpha-galactosidase n=1 Tax=Pseudolactococcus carnosus TaxID=2749961 RepID=UPI001FBB474E|nr:MULTISPECIES: alpha-galactosidase [Lactococcus]MCJ1992403.1 alpha-galactosidase [Lactococcus carnosus]MCJ2001154.1 alpha-galactosidase [Lactococcus carnosus]MDN5410310.1 alpha-galactosidase [Lactococcus sp.]MDN5412543.1 alpha-galactosidase [Lactococcus sp.]MDN5436898.1 alpha-galactosidase [Lactococcus sp.]